MQDEIKNSKEEKKLKVKNNNERGKEIDAKRRRLKRYIIIGVIIILIGIGYLSFKERKIRDLNNQKSKITNDYNKLKEKYSELDNDYSKLKKKNNELDNEYNKLKKAHKKLQNLPDVTVYADVDEKDVELTFYSTIEEAKENIKDLEYEHFFLDDVELTISVHNKKEIEEMKCKKGKEVYRIFPDSQNVYQINKIDNVAYICSLNMAIEEKILLTISINDQKMYTVFRPVEKK